MDEIRRISFAALVVFVMTVPLEDAFQISSIGRLSKAAGLLATTVWLVSLLITARLRRPTGIHLLAGAFFAWTALSVLWSVAPTNTEHRVVTLAQLVAIVWVVYDQADDDTKVARLMRGYVVGALIASLLTILAASRGLATKGPGRFGPNGADDANSIGCMIAVGVVMAWHLLAISRRGSWRWVYRSFMPIGIVATLLTASRGALVSLAIGLVIVAAWPSRLSPRRVLAIVVLAVVATTLAIELVPQKSFDRLSTTSSEITSGTLNNRTQSWARAWAAFSSHPLQGVGADGFRVFNPKEGGLGTAHNAVLETLADLGIIGGLLLLLTYGLAIAQLLVVERRHLDTWLAIIATWLAGFLTLPWEIRKISWLVLALMVSAAHVRVRSRRERTSTPTAVGAVSQPPGSRV